MTASNQACPKCSKPIMVFRNDAIRHIACPHCRVLLETGPHGISVATQTAPRLQKQTPPQPPQPRQPPVTPEPPGNYGLVIAAGLALSAIVVAAAIGGIVILGRSASKEKPDTESVVKSPNQPLTSTGLRSSPEESVTENKGADAKSIKPILEQKAAEFQQQAKRTASEPLDPNDSRNSPSPATSLATAVDSVRHAVVTLIHDGGGMGSGFLVQRRRWLATNLHVVAGASEAVAVRQRDDGSEWVKIRVDGFVACDPGTDLVILALNDDWPGRPLLLADKTPRLGEDVFAVGSPKGLTETITKGIISSVRSAADVGHSALAPSTTILQTDAFVTHGNSGGPLCTTGGNVVGINTFVRKNESGGVEFHFAVSAIELARLIQRANGPPRPLSQLPPMRD